MNKKKNLPFIIIALVLCLLFIVGGVLSVFYLTGTFPSYNAKVDTILAFAREKDVTEIIPADDLQVETPQIAELLPPIIIDGINIAQLFPYFAVDFSLQAENEKMPKITLVNKGNTFLEYELEFSLFDDRYSLKCDGIFERLSSDYSGEVYPKSTWEYRGDFPIISQPALFADAIVFIDAEPKLVQLDLQTGSVLKTMPSPAYPSDTAAIANENLYAFAGRDGKTYAFEFLDLAPIEEKNVQTTREYLEISRLLAYSEKTTTNLQEMLDTWMGVPVTFNLQAPLLLGDTQRPHLIPLQVAEPLIFAYAPQEQGTYTVGLCDENGRWITAQGFSAVFTGQGDFQSVSIDYVADKPQTTLHLSSNEFYYITVGLFPTRDNSEIPDSDEMTDANAISYFLMVKKDS